MRALVDRNDALARDAKEQDEVLDALEIEIDEMAITLLAKAPLASDLRLVTVAMKISHNLERVGDEATTIARRALEVNAADFGTWSLALELARAPSERERVIAELDRSWTRGEWSPRTAEPIASLGPSSTSRPR